MKNLITVLLIVLCCALCRAQDPNTTIEQNSTLPVQTIETLPWSEVTTNDFEHHGEGYLIDHLRNHPMLGNELERLHEWLHQKVEKLRPNGRRSFIVVECSDSELSSWTNRQSIESSGWAVVHVPTVGQRIRSVVALDRLHFAKQGFPTNDDLNKYNTQFQNRKFQPVKSARARFVKTLKVFTRANCSWCDKWMASEYSQAVADGVAIEFITDPNGTVPRFEICDESGQCRQYTGFTPWSKMKGNG